NGSRLLCFGKNLHQQGASAKIAVALRTPAMAVACMLDQVLELLTHHIIRIRRHDGPWPRRPSTWRSRIGLGIQSIGGNVFGTHCLSSAILTGPSVCCFPE